MQLKAIRNANKKLAISYKPEINNLFFFGHKNRNLILEYLVTPSSNNSESPFGSEYIHELLFNIDSAFKRDLLWSGLDPHELHLLKNSLVQIQEKSNTFKKLTILFKSISLKFKGFFKKTEIKT